MLRYGRLVYTSDFRTRFSGHVRDTDLFFKNTDVLANAISTIIVNIHDNTPDGGMRITRRRRRTILLYLRLNCKRMNIMPEIFCVLIYNVIFILKKGKKGRIHIQWNCIVMLSTMRQKGCYVHHPTFSVVHYWFEERLYQGTIVLYIPFVLDAHTQYFRLVSSDKIHTASVNQ